MYASSTNEITVEFDYVEALEDLTVEAILSFADTTSVQSSLLQAKSSQSSSSEYQKVQLASTSSVPKIIVNPSQLSLIIKLEGKNAALIVQSQTNLEVQKAASNFSLAVTILIMLQFFLGTFFHKMIGLETIQVLQFAFFARMTLDMENIFIFNALNPLKYSAYGGYTNYGIFFDFETKEIQSASNTEVSEEFLSIGMLRYFLLNVNLTLILPALSLIIYSILLMIKFKKRNNFMKSGLQSEKDTYTAAKRRSQRVYDNAVFPFINVLNMASLFCAILDLESSSSSGEHSDLIMAIEKSSFIVHMIILFVTFTIFTFEALTSYEDFKESRLTEE